MVPKSTISGNYHQNWVDFPACVSLQHVQVVSSLKNSLSQWLYFKLFGIICLIGKIKFKLLSQGPLAEWEKKNLQSHKLRAQLLRFVSGRLGARATLELHRWPALNQPGHRSLLMKHANGCLAKSWLVGWLVGWCWLVKKNCWKCGLWTWGFHWCC